MRDISGRMNRRQAVAAIGAGLALPLLPKTASAAALGELTLFGPPAGPSIVLAQAVHAGAIPGVAEKAAMKVWRSPDEMRAGLTSGTMQAVVLPVQVAANLYNRGMKLKLLNIMTKGLLYIVSTDPSISRFEDLKGKKLAVPFRNDMPDLVVNRLLAHYKLAAGSDLVVETTGTPVEGVQRLLAGQVDAVLAPEPACSAAIVLGKVAGKDVRRAIDVQAVWGEVTGKEPVLPQAGLAVTEAFMAADAGIEERLQAALAAAADVVNADPAAAAAVAAPALEMPQPVIEASIASSKLVAIGARAAREPIDAMLATLADTDAGIIGGRMPDDGFYL